MIRKAYRRLRALFREVEKLSSYFSEMSRRLDEIQMLLGQSLTVQHSALPAGRGLHRHEFKVFSQFGDDGIIQFLTHNVDIPLHCRTFVEFGVESYIEANTRFLLMHDNWRGLVLDGSANNIEKIRGQDIYWKHELTAECAFIDRDNINSLITRNGFRGEIGILSIDIDGNDYWVWEAIDQVDPIIVIVEYNSVLGIEHPVTVPYDPQFLRGRAHSSNLYWGASLSALYSLAKKKGLCFVGCNSAGNNAYFVRRDKLGSLRELSLEEGYVCSRFRESRDVEGRLTYLTGEQRREAISDMEVFDVEKQRTVRINHEPLRKAG